MEEIKIIDNECSVDKRSLNFSCEINGKKYKFNYNGWNDHDFDNFTVDDKPHHRGYSIITVYKHCLQAWLDIEGTDAKIFIDRRYEHNNSYDVYFQGKHYLVGKEL